MGNGFFSLVLRPKEGHFHIFDAFQFGGVMNLGDQGGLNTSHQGPCLVLPMLSASHGVGASQGWKRRISKSVADGAD